MILNAQMGWADHQAQIAVILVVVIFQHHQIVAGIGFLDDLRCPDGVAARFGQRLMIVPAIAANDIRNLGLIAVAGAREALEIPQGA